MANKYLRQGASGSGTGDDWTNAYTTLAALETGLARGDTGYVADGAYAGATFNTATSGTTLITIKKATIADHGTSTGWNDTYGDGVATFSSRFVFGSNYWVIDGVVGGGPLSWDSGHGFVITETGASSSVVDINSRTNITLAHTKLVGMNSGSSGGGSLGNDGISIGGGGNLTFQYLWIQNVGRCPVFAPTNGAGSFVFEYCHFDFFWADDDPHGETFAIYGVNAATAYTIRYNLITAVYSTGGIMWDNSNSHSATLLIYGNVFYRPSSATWDNANGVIGGWTGGAGEDCYSMRIYNNSFIDINILVFTNFITRSGDNEAINNLFYNCNSPSYSDIGTHDYNFYINSGGLHSEANGQTATSGDPFVNYTALDFNLTANTNAGQNLGSPYGTDLYGNPRTTWSRGAVEYNDEAPPEPGNIVCNALSVTSLTVG